MIKFLVKTKVNPVVNNFHQGFDIRIPLIQNTSFMSLYVINCMKLNKTFAVTVYDSKSKSF